MDNPHPNTPQHPHPNSSPWSGVHDNQGTLRGMRSEGVMEPEQDTGYAWVILFGKCNQLIN